MKVLAITQRLPDRLDEGAKFVTACDLALFSRISDVTVLPLEGMGNWNSALKIVAQHDGEPSRLKLSQLAQSEYSGVGFIGSSSSHKILSLLMGFVLRLPYICMRRYVSGFVDAVKAEIGKKDYDFVYLDGVSLGYLLSYLRETAVPYVYRCHDVISETFLRMAESNGGLKSAILSLESRRAGYLDAAVGRYAVGSLCLSEGNRKFLLDSGSSNVEISKPFLPASVSPVVRSGRFSTFRLGYLGNATYPPNKDGLEWFFENVWTALSAELPGLELVMAGKGVDLYSSKAGVVALGYVDSVQEFYEQVDLVIVPLLSGSGIRIKILDSLGHGVPLISTTVGAEGIEVDDPSILYRSDAPKDWVERIRAVSSRLRDDRVGGKAQSLIASQFSIDAAEEGVRRLLKGLSLAEQA